MTAQWKSLLDHVMSVPERVYETWTASEGWNNDTVYGRQFGENGVPWCVIWDWCMYSDVGLAGIVPKVDNVGVFSNWAKARGQWSEYPSVGAWVNFGDGAHTELVVGFDADTVYTKGGNSVKAGSSDGGQGNGVWSHTTARRSARVVGYFAPRFPDGQCPPTADPADPRGGRAQTSYRWPGPDPAAPTNPPEDDMPTPQEIAAAVWTQRLPNPGRLDASGSPWMQPAQDFQVDQDRKFDLLDGQLKALDEKVAKLAAAGGVTQAQLEAAAAAGARAALAQLAAALAPKGN